MTKLNNKINKTKYVKIVVKKWILLVILKNILLVKIVKILKDQIIINNNKFKNFDINLLIN